MCRPDRKRRQPEAASDESAAGGGLPMRHNGPVSILKLLVLKQLACGRPGDTTWATEMRADIWAKGSHAVGPVPADRQS